MITVSVPLFSDGSGHPGRSVVDSASTVLYRNGQKIATHPSLAAVSSTCPPSPVTTG